MKSIFLLLLPFCLIFHACGETVSTTEQKKAPTHKKEIEVPKKLLRHIVLFKFNEKATDDIVKKIEQAFAGLKNKISVIHDFEWGINNSPEGLDNGLTHCFLVTFLTEKDRATYLPHPDHQDFVKLITPYVEDVTVVDYWTD